LQTGRHAALPVRRRPSAGWSGERGAGGVRSAGRATVLALALASLTGCGIAERAGRGASQGFVTNLAQKVQDREAIAGLAEDVQRRGARGIADTLSQPQQIEDLQRIS